MKKKLMTVLALVLVVAMSVAGTIAFLTDTTDPITNTFTVGKVDIDLTETFNTDTDDNGAADAWQAQLIPGTTYAKDPVVTVTADSEDCWLFVKFEEKNDAATYLDYTSNLTAENDWTRGDGTNIPSNVWYRAVAKDATVKSFHLLANDTVTIDSTAVTNDNMNDAANAELVYTAYACQKDNMSVEAAWAHFTTP